MATKSLSECSWNLMDFPCSVEILHHALIMNMVHDSTYCLNIQYGIVTIRFGNILIESVSKWLQNFRDAICDCPKKPSTPVKLWHVKQKTTAQRQSIWKNTSWTYLIVLCDKVCFYFAQGVSWTWILNGLDSACVLRSCSSVYHPCERFFHLFLCLQIYVTIPRAHCTWEVWQASQNHSDGF